MRIDLTRSKTYEVAYPYDGNALDTSNILREHYWPHRDIDFLKKNQRKKKPPAIKLNLTMNGS